MGWRISGNVKARARRSRRQLLEVPSRALKIVLPTCLIFSPYNNPFFSPSILLIFYFHLLSPFLFFFISWPTPTHQPPPPLPLAVFSAALRHPSKSIAPIGRSPSLSCPPSSLLLPLPKISTVGVPPIQDNLPQLLLLLLIIITFFITITIIKNPTRRRRRSSRNGSIRRLHFITIPVLGLPDLYPFRFLFYIQRK